MKIKDRGYWISKLFIWQSFIYFVVIMIRFRSLSFLRFTNPGMHMSGFLDDKKSELYQLIPEHYLPATELVSSLAQAKSVIDNNKICYPIVLKPDIGLKGINVAKVDNDDGLAHYFEMANQESTVLIQEYLDQKKEFSFFYFRIPNTNKQGVSSILEKTYPKVTGDGQTKLRDLITQNNNPYLKKDWIFKNLETRLESIPVKGREIVIDPIGNYSRGAAFHDHPEYLGRELDQMSHSLFSQINGLNFCRVDCKANSIEDLIDGRFKILEINGAKSEPIQIYDRNKSLGSCVIDIHNHWKIIYKIVKNAQTELFEKPSLKSIILSLIAIKKAMK